MRSDHALRAAARPSAITLAVLAASSVSAVSASGTVTVTPVAPMIQSGQALAPMIGAHSEGLAGSVTLMASGDLGRSRDVISGSGPEIEPPAGALRYHRLLRSRPTPGYLFDRFVQAWMVEASSASLEQFLRQQVDGEDVADDLLLAFRLTSEGRHVEAITTLRAALERNPDHPLVLFEKAKVETATLDFAEALRDLAAASEAVDLEPDLADEIATVRARLLVRIGRRDEALGIWSTLLESRPDDAALHEDLIRTQIDEGEFEAAIDTIDRLLAITDAPRERVGHRMWRADVLRDAGRNSEAIDAYVGLLTDVGRDSWIEREILAQLEFVHRRLGDPVAWELRLEELIAEDPTRVALIRRLAAVMAERGDVDASMDAWRAIIERAPDDAELRSEYVSQLVAASRLDDAIVQLEALAVARPADAAIPMRLARVLHDAGRTEDVTAAIESFLLLSGDDLAAWGRAARVYLEFERPDDAVLLARRLHQADPQATERRRWLADVLMETGGRDEAIVMWRSLASESDSLGTVAIARSLMARGERRVALDLLFERAPDFGDDPAFLAAMVDAARGDESEIDVLPFAERWVVRSTTAADMTRAITATSRLARRTGALPDLITRLEANDAPEIAERCLLAELHEIAGDSEAADAALAPLLSGDDELDPRPRLQAVRLRTLRRDWAEAARMLAPLADRVGPGRSAIYRQLIDLNRRADELEVALTWARRWRVETPGTVLPWTEEARLLDRLGRAEDSLAVLEEAGRRFSDTSVRDSLAAAYARSGRTRMAEATLRALYEDATTVEARLRWARRLAESVRWTSRQAAIENEFARRLAEDRTDIGAALALATVHEVLGDLSRRRLALLEASRIDPDDQDLLLTLAGVEEQLGNIDGARGILDRLQGMDRTERAMMRRVSLELRVGDADSAVRVLTAPGAPSPSAEIALEFADRLFAAGELDAATTYLRRQRASHPDDPRLPFLLGIIAREQGDRTDTAVDMMLEVIESETEFTPATGSGATVSRRGTSVVGSPRVLATLPRFVTRLNEFRALSQSALQTRDAGVTIINRAGRFVEIPPNLEALRGYALAHLMDLAGPEDGPKRTAIVDAIEERGISDVDLLFRVADPATSPSTLIKLLDAYPDHRGIGALVADFAAGSTRLAASAGSERLREIAEREADRYPAVSLSAHCGLVRIASRESGAAVRDALDALLEQTTRISTPTPMDIRRLGALVRPAWARDQTTIDVDTAGIDRIDAILTRALAFAEDDGIDPSVMTWLYPMLVNALGTIDDTDRIATLTLRLLEEHRGRSDARPGPRFAAPIARVQGGTRTRVTYRPLEFPPPGLESIPRSLMVLLAPRTTQPVGAIHEDFDPAALLAELDRRDADPLLRAVLAASMDQDGRALDILQGVLDHEHATAEHRTLAGTIAARSGDHARAIAAFRRAAQLPMANSMRSRIDEAVLASAIALGDDALTGELRSAVGASGLRISRVSATHQERLAIVLELETLGLVAQAEEARRRLQATPNPTRRAGRAPGVSIGTTSRSVLDRIERLVEKDHIDAATRLISLELSRGARVVGNSPNTGRWFWDMAESRELIELATSNDLVDAIIEHADPGPGASTAATLRIARIMSVLGRTGAAIERITAATEAMGSDAVDLLLFAAEIALAEGMGRASGEFLGRIDLRRSWAEVDHMLGQLEASAGRNREGAEHAAEMLEAFITTTADPTLIRRDLGRGTLDALRVTRDPNPDQKDAARRRVTHQRLSRLLVGVPASANSAFVRMTGITPVTKDFEERLAPFAEQAMIAAARTMATNTSQPTEPVVRTWYHWTGSHEAGTDRLVPLTPAAVLLHRAAATGDDTPLRRVIAALRAAGRGDDATRLDGLTTMFIADGPDRNDAIVRLMAAPELRPSTDRVRLLTVGRGRIWAMIAAAEFRPLDVAGLHEPMIRALIDENADTIEATFPTGLQLPDLVAWAGLLVDRGRDDLATDLVNRTWTAIVGPEDAPYLSHPELVEALSSTPRRDTRVGHVNTLLAELSKNSMTLHMANLLAVDLLEDDHLAISRRITTRSRDWLNVWLRRPFEGEVGAGWLEALLRFPVVADVEGFNPVVVRHFPGSRAPQTLLHGIADGLNAALRGSGPEPSERVLKSPAMRRRAVVLDWIESQPTPTFGASMLELALRHPPAEPLAWWSLLAAHRDALAAAPAPVLARVRRALPESAILAASADPSVLDADRRAVADLLFAEQESRADTLLAAFAAARERYTFGSDPSALARRAAAAFEGLARDDRDEEAVQVFVDLRESIAPGRSRSDRAERIAEGAIKRLFGDLEPRIIVRLVPELHRRRLIPDAVVSLPELRRPVDRLADSIGIDLLAIDARTRDMSRIDRRFIATVIALGQVADPDDADFFLSALADLYASQRLPWTATSDHRMAQFIRGSDAIPDWARALAHDATAIATAPSKQPDTERGGTAATERTQRVGAVLARAAERTAMGIDGDQPDWSAVVGIPQINRLLKSLGSDARDEDITIAARLITEVLTRGATTLEVPTETLITLMRTWRSSDARIKEIVTDQYLMACARRSIQLRRLGYANDLQQDVPYFSDGEVGSREPVMAELLLERSLDLTGTARREQLFDVYPELASSPLVWASLLRAGAVDKAARLVRRHWKEVAPGHDVGRPYDATLDAAIAELDGAIAERDVAIYVRTMLELTSDGDQPGTPSRRERLMAIAEQVLEMDFDRSILEGRVLAMLGTEPDALGVVADRVSRVAARVDLEQLDEPGQDAPAWAFQVVLADALGHLRRGRSDRYFALLDRLPAFANNPSSRRPSGLASRALTSARAVVTPFLADGPDARALAVRIHRAELAARATFRDPMSGRHIIGDLFMASLAFGDEPGHRAWLESIGGPEIKTHPGVGWESDPDALLIWPINIGRQRLDQRSLSQAIERYGDLEGVPRDARATLLLSVADRAPFSRVSPGEWRPWFDILRDEELVEHGFAIGERTGAWTTLAVVAGQRASRARGPRGEMPPAAIQGLLAEVGARALVEARTSPTAYDTRLAVAEAFLIGGLLERATEALDSMTATNPGVVGRAKVLRKRLDDAIARRSAGEGRP